MLEYDWANPSSILLPDEDTPQNPHQQTRPDNFDPYPPPTNFSHYFINNPQTHFTNPNTHQQYPFHQPQNFYDPYTHPGSIPVLDPTGFMPVPKTEPAIGPPGFEFNSRIGLNLGGRTYFASSEDDDFVNRLYRRSRLLEPGSINSPRCQAEGCHADLSHCKHYHRRHKVCEFHSKAATVVAAGLTQRFCQQCSRFHVLSEFDNGKRSCRRRLADHNRRRRKSSQQQASSQENSGKLQGNAPNSSSENLPRSPPDSGAHSSSVTAGVSSPRISLDCFGNRPYSGGATSSSTASTTSLFYSNE